jgi:hypothetical protein
LPPRHHGTHTHTETEWREREKEREKERVERERERELGAETLTEERGMPTTPERVSSIDWMQLPPSVSVKPYPWMMGQIAAEQNSCTCL